MLHNRPSGESWSENAHVRSKLGAAWIPAPLLIGTLLSYVGWVLDQNLVMSACAQL